MYNDLKEQLKRLNAITPDESFARRSKSAILAFRQEPVRKPIRFPVMSLFWVGAAAAALVVAVVLFPAAPNAPVSALNTDRLTQELDNFNINVQLQEIHYQQTSNQEIASALNEISNTETRHLNSDLLNSEIQQLNSQPATNPQIDQLLNQVIF